MHLKVENAEAAVKEEALAAVAKEKVTVAAREKAMAAVTEEVLAAEDVKVEAVLAEVSEISLVNHVKVEMLVEVEDAKAAEAETEDADLNTHTNKQTTMARISGSLLFITSFKIQLLYQSLLGQHRFPALRLA